MGLVLLLLVGYAGAETIAASAGSQGYPTAWQACGASCTSAQFQTPAQACTYRSATVGSCKSIQDGACREYYCNGGDGGFAATSSAWLQYSCPTGQNWTLSGSNCTRPDCVAPQVRDPATGQCEASPCTAGDSVSFSIFSGYSLGKDQVTGGTANPFTNASGRCNGQCVFDVASVSSCPAVVGTVDSPTAITCHGTGTLTGASCTNDESTAPLPPTVPHHRPKCLAGEGVLTSSSGTVACVPSGTPSSAPVVRTDKQTQQFPDGSSRTTETTYTKDPVTQVQDTQQQITNTPATGGGAGQAGSVGTTTSSGSTEPSSPTEKEASDFCKANGQLQICKGDMNKEETQKQVRDYIKSLTDPASTPYTGLETAKHTDQSQTDLQTELDKFTSAGTGLFTPDASSKSSWESAMASGWFEPIARAGCQPYSATISGRVWNLDICPAAEKISSISEYVIWFFVVVGVFVMFTGGAFRKGS